MLDPKTQDILRQIINASPASQTHRFFIFGSRVTGTARRYSDIDLGIKGNKPLNIKTFFDLETALENSNLPYKVDLVDFAKVSPTFKKIALQHTLYLN